MGLSDRNYQLKDFGNYYVCRSNDLTNIDVKSSVIDFKENLSKNKEENDIGLDGFAKSKEVEESRYKKNGIVYVFDRQKGQYKPLWKKEIFTKGETPQPYNLISDAKGNILVKDPDNNGEYRPIDIKHDFIPLYGVPIKNIDFSNNPDLLRTIQYDDKTFDSSCILPEGYDVKKVVELGKNRGLNVKAMHDMGVTGKGQKIAIIDWALNSNKEYDENIVCYEEMPNVKKSDKKRTYHGASVTSLAAGKTTGIAPDADIFYFASSAGEGKQEEISEDQKNALQRIYDINSNLPENERIKIVSISSPIFGEKESADLVQKLEKQGVTVLYSPKACDKFGYLEKIDSMGNPDDFENYKVRRFSTEDNGLYLNCGDVTVASSTNKDGYRHDGMGGQSWLTPQIAGLYACARSVDNSLTFDEFIDAAHKTSYKKIIQRPDMSAKSRILQYGDQEIKKQICAELFGKDYDFKRIDIESDKMTKIMDIMKKRYMKKDINGIDIWDSQKHEQDCARLAENYKQKLIQQGIIDKNEDYTSAEMTVNIIDAEELIKYLKK